MQIVPGDKVDVMVAAKGGGSENKSKFVMLNPSDSIVDWVMKTVPTMGAGWCPPGMLGIGIGGTAEKAMTMAKEALMDDIDMSDLLKRGPQTRRREAARRTVREGQRAGHRRAGPGWTVHRARRQDQDVPDPRRRQAGGDDSRTARRPAMRTSCSTVPGPPTSIRRRSIRWPKVNWQPDEKKSTRVNLDTLTKAECGLWKPGQTLLLNGKMLTGRDAAHKRIQDMLAKGEKLPVDFTNRVIYYVGPVDPVRDEVVGPAGPTTATRMDKFTEMMLAQTGLIAMIGKAERGPVAIEAIRKHKSAYLMAVGGAAYLVAKAIKGVEGRRLRRSRHGSDLRVRREGHAGHGRGQCRWHLGAPDRAEGVAGEDRQDPGCRRPERSEPVRRNDSCARPGVMRPSAASMRTTRARQTRTCCASISRRCRLPAVSEG